LHVHCVAHRLDGPAHVRRDTARCQPVYDVFGLYKYLAKAPEPYSLAAELDATAARVMRPSGRLPNTRRHFLSADRLEWAVAQCPKHQTIQNTTPADPQTATTATSTHVEVDAPTQLDTAPKTTPAVKTGVKHLTPKPPAATLATTDPKTPPRPRPGPLSYHRAPPTSARPCKPSRPRERGPPTATRPPTADHPSPFANRRTP
jgi:hypothetical protein